MGLHGNAKLGPAGRRAMVMDVVGDGFSRRQAAARHGVCATTAKRWVDRYEGASVKGHRRVHQFRALNCAPLLAGWSW